MERPHVHVNVAMSLDGKIDTAARTGAPISPAADKARVDRLRAGADAVLVGGRTLLDEDPKLAVKSLALREERKALGLPENPAKVGIVSVADLKPDGDFMTAGPARRLIFTTGRTDPGQVARLREAGVEVFVLDGEQPELTSVLESLHGLGIRRLLVEGGGTILAEFFRLGLVDEVSVYVAARIFGGASAPTPADGPGFPFEQATRLQLVSAEKFDGEGGVLLQYSIPHK
jgi:2,5-diamino-6-(ribosylamino)-4(3H)-pyrimidinone 5'-phosphate reductase